MTVEKIRFRDRFVIDVVGDPYVPKNIDRLLALTENRGNLDAPAEGGDLPRAYNQRDDAAFGPYCSMNAGRRRTLKSGRRETFISN